VRLSVGIDPSTTSTGLVILREEGSEPHVCFAGAFKWAKDDKRAGLTRALDIQQRVWDVMASYGCFGGDEVQAAIEGYGYASPKLMPSVEIGTLLRVRLYDAGIPYLEPAPNQLKKFAGMVMDPRKKLKGKAAKPIAQVKERWGFEHPTHDVIDAFVLAQIARARGSRLKLTEAQADVMLACRQGASK